MDTIFIEYCSLIIITIFSLLYIKFRILNKNNQELQNQKTNSNNNPSNIVAEKNITTQINNICNNDSNPILSDELNIDEMISSIHKSLDNDNSCVSQTKCSKNEIKALSVICAAYNELTNKNTFNNNNNMYDDYFSFDDENEYDSDKINDYDEINNRLRNDVNKTLNKINNDNSTSTWNFVSTSNPIDSSISSIYDTIHAPNELKNALNHNNNVIYVNEYNDDDDDSDYIDDIDDINNEIQENEFEYEYDDDDEDDIDDIVYIKNNTNHLQTSSTELFERDLLRLHVDLNQFPKEEPFNTSA